MKRVLPFLLFLICASFSSAKIIHVPGDHNTIQEAIENASDGDTIIVAEGTYKENLNFMGKGITLASLFLMDEEPSHIAATIIDGSSPTNPDTASVIYIPEGSGLMTEICGLTITGGSGTIIDDNGEIIRLGGGIYIEGANGLIKNNIIEDNQIKYNFAAVKGAGVFALGGEGVEIHLLDNTISENKLESSQHTIGAGIMLFDNQTSCKFVVMGNIISENQAVCTTTKRCYGGGMNCSFFLPTVSECIITQNLIENNQLHGHATNTYGGAIRIAYDESGGWYIDNHPSPVISNNIIRNNSADPGGGTIGIWTYWYQHDGSSKVTPQPFIVNNTIVDNLCSGASGIFNWQSYPMVMNNIFWNQYVDPTNSKEPVNVEIPVYGTNYGKIFAVHNDIRGGFEPEEGLDINNYSEDPAFLTDSSGLSDTSICVGHGWDSLIIMNFWYKAPDTDYFGNPRPDPVNTNVDIGAVESDKIDKIPPVLSAPDSLYQPDSIGISCTEHGMIFLVPESTARDIVSILNDSLASNWVSIKNPTYIKLDGYDNGTYWLYGVDNTGNISEPEPFKIYGVGIHESETACFSIYPNPFREKITIRFNRIMPNLNIDLVSPDGRILKRIDDITEDLITIERGNLQPGLYFLKIHGDKTYVEKILVQ